MRVFLLIPLLIVAAIAVDPRAQRSSISRLGSDEVLEEKLTRLGPDELPEEKLTLWNENWRRRIQKMYQAIRRKREESIRADRSHRNKEAVIEEEREKIKFLLRRYLKLAPQGPDAPDEASGEEDEIPDKLVDELMGDTDKDQMWNDAVLNHGIGKYIESVTARANKFFATVGNAIQHAQHAPGRIGGIPAGGPPGNVPAFHPAGRVFAW